MKKIIPILFFLAAVIPSKATVVIINVSSFVFTPNAVTVDCDDTIRFHRVNGTHPVVSETAAWTTFTMSGALVNKDIVLTTAGTYAYYCQLHGAAGGVGMAGTITVTCEPPSCNTPTGITVSNITSSKAKISWTAAAGATKYQIQYRKVGVATWSKANTTMTQKTLMSLEANTTYQYKVKTICDALSSSFSPVATFTTLPLRGEAPMEMDMEDHASKMAVFPNPTDGKFQLVVDHVHVAEVFVEIYDMSGRMIYKNTFSPLEEGIVEDIILPEGFSGNAVVKVNVGGNVLIEDILVQ